MIQIKNVIPKEDYLLEVQLENGHSVILDFSSRLHTVRFGMFADKAFFQHAVTDGDCIWWENKIELSASRSFSWHRNSSLKDQAYILRKRGKL